MSLHMFLAHFSKLMSEKLKATTRMSFLRREKKRNYPRKLRKKRQFRFVFVRKSLAEKSGIGEVGGVIHINVVGIIFINLAFRRVIIRCSLTIWILIITFPSIILYSTVELSFRIFVVVQYTICHNPGISYQM